MNNNVFDGRRWLWIILADFVVGLLARLLKPGRDRTSTILTTLFGSIDALLAGWVGRIMGWYEPAGFIASLSARSRS